jgi:hypothetical protein
MHGRAANLPLPKGMLIPSATREQFGAELESEAELWSQTIRRGNITIE